MTDTSDQIAKFKELIDKSNKILITSHVSPDADSICSMLLLGLALEVNFPDKQITMVSEESANQLKFLPGYNKIKIQRLVEAVENQDLIIIVDAMNFGRCSRFEHQDISKKVKEQNTTLAIIDHHEPVGVEENNLYINNDNAAATQEIYELLFRKLNMQKPDGFAEIAMAGIYSDTAGFTYLKDNFQDTLDIAGELMSAGANLEVIKNKLNQYTLDDVNAIKEILSNAKTKDEYTYSFISDGFVGEWIKSGKPSSSLNAAKAYFMNNFSRNLDGKQWGFALYKEQLLGDNFYSISFRAINGVKDVALLANKLSGGGHKAAAGAQVQAQNVEEAIQKIQNVIAEDS